MLTTMNSIRKSFAVAVQISASSSRKAWSPPWYPMRQEGLCRRGFSTIAALISLVIPFGLSQDSRSAGQKQELQKNNTKHARVNHLEQCRFKRRSGFKGDLCVPVVTFTDAGVRAACFLNTLLVTRIRMMQITELSTKHTNWSVKPL